MTTEHDIDEIVSFQNHCILMADELSKLPAVSVLENTLVYTALKVWKDYIDKLDLVIEEIKAEQYRYSG
jgi:hypothetical protein